VRPDAGPTRGVLREGTPSPGNEHRRVLPVPALAEFVAHFWYVSWSLDEPTLVETLPHPTVHLVFEDGPGCERRAEVAGIHRRRFTRELRGTGRTFGIKFRPAMFQPFFGAKLSSLRAPIAPIERVLGEAGAALAAAIFERDEFEARILAAERFLEPRLPPVPVALAQLRDLVEQMAEDRALLRVDDTAQRLGVDVRTLQRRFHDYVGVSPKWVIRRYRLHDAAERLKAENPPTLAALARELGYADQAHFARDFSEAVGRTPAVFANAEGKRGPGK
jgi:AraC-like DNA-binding protein